MPDRTQGDDAARRVDALRRRYELTEAETLARRSLDQNGDDPGLLIAWGRLLLATHRPDQALATFRRAEELDADHPRAVAWQIATLSRDRRTADAATLAETALRRFPTSALVHVAAGRALLDSSRPQDAVRHFADADGTLAAEEVCLCWQAAALVGVSASAEAEALLRAHLAKDPAAVKARYRLGRVLLHDDRPAEALECFDAVLDACPDHDDALCRKVEALRRARRFSEAEAFAEEAMERLPGCPGLHTELAWVLSAQDREDEAVTRVERALAIDPRDPWALLSRIDFLRYARRFEEAERAAAEAERLLPRDPDVCTTAAWVLSAQDREDEAVTRVERALAIDPRDPWALLSRIDFLRYARRYEEAEQAAAEAVRLHPRNPRLHVAAGSVSSSRHREEEALAHVERALGIDPRHSQALRSRMDFLRFSGRFEEAERAAEEAVRVRPDDPDVLTVAAWVFSDQDREEEALEWVERALTVDPRNVWALCWRVNFLQSGRRFEEAERAVEEAVRLRPDDPYVFTTAAWVFSAQDREEEALQWVERALAIDPRDVWALRSRMDFLRFSGRFEEAERAAAKAVGVRPGDPDVHLSAAWVHSDRYRFDAALEHLEKALELDPGRSLLLRNRIDLLRRALRFEEAERAVEEAVRLRPGDSDLYATAAWVFSDQGRDDEALAYAGRALAIDPRNTQASRDRVDFLRSSRRFEEAERAAEELLRQRPDDPEALTSAAWVLCAQDREDEGLAYIERALAIEPANVRALRARIDFLRYSGRYKAAEQAAAESVRLQPRDAGMYTAAAWVFSDQDREEEALVWAGRALAVDPCDSWALRSRVDFLRYAWRYDEAERAAAEAVRLRPDDPDVHTTAAWVASDQDREGQALEHVGRALAIDRRDGWALRSRVDFLRYSRRYEEAGQAAAEIGELRPGDPEAQVAAARVFSDQDRYDEALAHLGRALEIDPHNSPALRGRVRALCLARRYQEAESAAAEALRLRPNDPEAHVAAARVDADQDRYDDALAHLDRALAIDQDNANALGRRVRTLRAMRAFKEAERAATEAIALRPNRMGLRIELGRVYDDQARFEEALACYDDVLAREADNVEARIARSAVLRSRRLCPEAERDIARWIEEKPEDRSLKAELAWIHHDERRAGEARRIFEGLLETAIGGRERAKAQGGLGWVAFSAQEYAEAERRFRAAIEEAPGAREYELGLAWALTRQSGKEAREEAVRIAHDLTAAGVNASAHVCLGVLAFKSGNLLSAEYHLKKALAIDPHHGGHIDLGALYVQMARHEEAEEQLRLAVTRKWHESAAHIELGNLYLQGDEERLPAAEREFRQALAIDPDSGPASIGLAQALARTGDEAEAERVLRQVLARQDHRDRWHTCTALARLLVQRGDKQQNSDLYAEAYTEAQRAIGLAPDTEADPHFVAGVAHHRLGSLTAEARGRFAYRRRAMHHLRECLRREPNHVEAQRNLNLLQREVKAAAPALWGGFVVACISFALLAVMWTMFFFTAKVPTTLLMVNTPILVGLITVAALLPALIRLKLPGFEADLQAGGMSVSPGPTGENTFGPGRFTVTSGPGKLALAEGPTGQLPHRK